MNRKAQLRLAVLALAAAGWLSAQATRAEVIEEIVAWVEGSVITLSEFREEEQLMAQDLYRNFTGEELDRELTAARSILLMNLIDGKILLNKASRMFDLDRAGESYVRMLREQQGIATEDELVRLLSREGMTLEEFQDQLVERFAPQEVIRTEVGNRVAVGDKEVEAYYDANLAEFDRPGSVLLREIVILTATPGAGEEKRAEAEQVRARLLEPAADFAAIAKEVSDAGTAAEGGLLGPLQQGELSETLEQVAFSLPPGEVSEILEMPYGFHIVRVEERTDPSRATLDEVREDLRRRLEDEKYAAAVSDYLRRAREEVDWQVNPKYKDRIPEEYQARVRR